ncbi:hypothetical protein DYB35_005644 [Aphanomyces astaci]|uniref:PHD-type domain-containing protein n=1 Tax=Aphanomyces astaci TaxID=112090 RepID=A0A3R7B7P8_APHAT|nr:hypothetical protein DYB35_005644 [Aphanomyces astaci]
MDALCDHALFNFSVQDADLMDYIEAIQGLLVASPDTDEDQALVLNAINVVEEYILATPHTKATYSYLLPSVSLLKQELSYYVSVPSTLDGPVITDDEQGSMSGALMPSHVPNTWVHMSCAIYLPELYFLHHNVVGLDALKPRRKLKCMFCKQPNKGACAQCAHPKCTASYHPSIKYFRAYFQNKADSRHVPALGYAVPPVVRRHRRVSMQAKNVTNTLMLPPLDEGDMVQVAARTWPGINKLGGTGRIKAKHVVDGRVLYDIAYILGGTEKGVERQYITPVSEDNPVNMASSCATVNEQDEDEIERWTVYAEYTAYFQHHPSVQRAQDDGFHLTFQQVIGDDEETLQEITNKKNDAEAAMYGQVVVTAVVGQDETMMEEEDEILRELEICQGRLDQLEAGIQAQLTPVMEKLSKERRDLYDTKLERLVASQVEVTYNQLINLQHQHDNMNDSSDDEDDDDEPRHTETPKPLVDQVAPPPVEEEEERLNPLFASISESTGHVCVLCGVSGGDLAATSCGHKAHIMCLLYTPETYFEHAMGFGVANIPPRRRTLVCALCKTSTGVNKIQCHAKKCTKPMHVQMYFVANYGNRR